MKNIISNPFNITKAVDFSDQQINDFWVDFPAEGFVGMAKPASPMPMIIIGGKGSGKTHLMRYFSYPLQKIRNQNIEEGINKDGYLGIYLRCGGLNSSRFQGKGQSDEKWREVFSYYMELWLAQLFLDTISNGFKDFIDDKQEETICKEILNLIDNTGEAQPNSIDEIKNLLRLFQKTLDFEINNCAIRQKLDIKINITRGKLIFGLPQILSKSLAIFKDSVFLYLIDEFENLSEPQQKYINTLMREKELPCSFKIGARNYGIKTYRTYSDEEENKEGSEFEKLQLDKCLRGGSKNYKLFAKRLILKRLSQHGYIQSNPSIDEDSTKSLSSHFEYFDSDHFATEQTKFVIKKFEGKIRPYFKKLKEKLILGFNKGLLFGVSDLQQVEKIIENLECLEYPFLEKVNILQFYKEWASENNLLDASEKILKDCQNYIESPSKKENSYLSTIGHFKFDLLSQLLKECDQKQKYLGIDTFIELSWGFPRHLLIILKHIFSWAEFHGEKPFSGNPITVRSQINGLKEATEWFYQDARKIGLEGVYIQNSIDRLGTLFKTIRFSDKPSECSCSSFSFDISKASPNAQKFIELAINWSFLVQVGIQKQKNSERIDWQIQLSRMLAPRWDLSIYRRGTIPLLPNEINAIFDPEESESFKAVCDLRGSKMNAPNFGKKIRALTKNTNQKDLPFKE